MRDELTRTMEQLGWLKTDSAFAKAVAIELKEEGLDLDVLDDCLNIERDKAFRLFKKFGKSGLKNWELQDLQNSLMCFICDSEFVYNINERYEEVTGKKNNFYNQYSALMQDVCGKLELEIAYQQRYGGKRNMGDR